MNLWTISERKQQNVKEKSYVCHFMDVFINVNKDSKALAKSLWYYMYLSVNIIKLFICNTSFVPQYLKMKIMKFSLWKYNQIIHIYDNMHMHCLIYMSDINDQIMKWKLY